MVLAFSSKLMSPRHIDGSKSNPKIGSTRLLTLVMNSGSTWWAPMEWLAPDCIGAGWRRYSSGSSMQFSRTLTGGSYLLMISHGLYMELTGSGTLHRSTGGAPLPRHPLELEEDPPQPNQHLAGLRDRSGRPHCTNGQR